MAGEAVAQGVRPDPFGNACRMRRFGCDAVNLPCADGLEIMLTGEQPAIGVHHAFLAPDLPPFPEQHALTVDIPDPQVGDLGSAKACPLGN
jgi:hypothetical protein